MSWQDIVIAAANIIFSASLTVQVCSGFKEKAGPIKLLTSIPTTVGLFAMAVTFWSLGLYFSTIIATCSGILWLLLFIQRLLYQKKNSA